MAGRSERFSEADANVMFRAKAVKVLAALGILAGMLLSPRLWIGPRSYPLNPVFPFLSPEPLTSALFVGTFVVSLIATIAMERPHRAISVALPLAFLLILFDQSRLQPWLYLYGLTLGLIGVFDLASTQRDRSAALNACRFVVATVYIWSGIQKMNPGFRSSMLPWLIQPLVGDNSSVWVHILGALIPFAEAALGIALLIRSTRNLAVIAAGSMHLFLLFLLGPFGHASNSVIWPWNVVMALIVVALFWNTPVVSSLEIVAPDTPVLVRGCLVVIVLMPALSLFGYCDGYLAWALYSGNKATARVEISDSLWERLPVPVRQYVYEEPARPGFNIVDIDRWSAQELNVPVYAEPRVYKSLARALCPFARQRSDLKLTIFPKRVLQGNSRELVNIGCPVA